jgi:hypothetical protein
MTTTALQTNEECFGCANDNDLATSESEPEIYCQGKIRNRFSTPELNVIIPAVSRHI